MSQNRMPTCWLLSAVTRSRRQHLQPQGNLRLRAARNNTHTYTNRGRIKHMLDLQKLKGIGAQAAQKAKDSIGKAKNDVQQKRAGAAAAAERYIVALDIGTEYVKALIGKITADSDEVEIVGVGRSRQ